MSKKEPNFEEIAKAFISESEKLESLISSLPENLKETKPKVIVPIYYQIMNVTSLIQVLEQDDVEFRNHKKLFEKFKSTKGLINNVFNSKLHPTVLTQLNKAIQESMDSLKSNNAKERTKEMIERESKLYEKLRELMSTKEFVEQYDKLVRK